MCQWFSQKIYDDENSLNDVWFSGESHFLLNGHVNSHKWVFWRRENPFKVVGVLWIKKNARHGSPSRSMTLLDHFSFKIIRVTQWEWQNSVAFQQFWTELKKREHLKGAQFHTANVTTTWYLENLGSVSSAAKLKWNGQLTRLTWPLTTPHISSSEDSSKTTSTRAPLLYWKQSSLRWFKRSLRRNMHALSANLHTAFNSDFN